MPVGVHHSIHIIAPFSRHGNVKYHAAQCKLKDWKTLHFSWQTPLTSKLFLYSMLYVEKQTSLLTANANTWAKNITNKCWMWHMKRRGKEERKRAEQTQKDGEMKPVSGITVYTLLTSRSSLQWTRKDKILLQRGLLCVNIWMSKYAAVAVLGRNSGLSSYTLLKSLSVLISGSSHLFMLQLQEETEPLFSHLCTPWQC